MKPPVALRITKALLWIYAIGVLLFQVFIVLPKFDLIDFSSWLIAIFAFVAAAMLTIRSRNIFSYYLGIVSLFWIIARAVLTIRVQVPMWKQFEFAFSSSIGTAGITICIAILLIGFVRARPWFVGHQTAANKVL